MVVLTGAALRTVRAVRDEQDGTVHTRAGLERLGCSRSQTRARLAARRWQLIGHAVVTHNGPLTRAETWQVGLLNSGSRAVLTSFTALEADGLVGWNRPEVHVLVPGGARVTPGRVPGLVVHRTRDWAAVVARRQRHLSAPAAIVAASSLSAPRSACGLVAAVVQQQLASCDDLAAALSRNRSVFHRTLLASAVSDIGMGADALSEIDFVALCRRFGLPSPRQQAVRVEPSGRRRYLDASWVRGDGQTVAVEIDGGLHLRPGTWWADQDRQNEIVISGVIVLRFPSAIVRIEPERVASQVRRALQL
jgi:hypothetical protein